MRTFIKVVKVLLWTILSMIAGNCWGVEFPLKIMAIIAGGIILFLLGAFAQRRSDRAVEVE